MNRIPHLTPVIATLALSALLAACGRAEDPTVGQQVDKAIAQTEQAGAELKSGAEQMATQAGQAVTDAGITARVNSALAADEKLSALRIDVDTSEGRVTLNGTAPDAASLQRATVLAQAVDGVKSVDNKLVVSQQG